MLSIMLSICPTVKVVVVVLLSTRFFSLSAFICPLLHIWLPLYFVLQFFRNVFLMCSHFLGCRRAIWVSTLHVSILKPVDFVSSCFAICPAIQKNCLCNSFYDIFFFGASSMSSLLLGLLLVWDVLQLVELFLIL